MAYDLCSVGEALRAVRQEKGLTIEEVSRLLSIEKHFIEGIETGDWNGLPDPFYVKAYVSSYTAFLDIVDELEPGVVSRKGARHSSKHGSEAPSAVVAVTTGLLRTSTDSATLAASRY